MVTQSKSAYPIDFIGGLFIGKDKDGWKFPLIYAHLRHWVDEKRAAEAEPASPERGG